MTRPVSHFTSIRPEPARFWIRHRPRTWPGDGLPWLDLATGGISFGDPRVAVPDLEAGGLDELVYLPPLDEEYDDELRAVARVEAIPPLVQRRPGRGSLGSLVTEVWDPLVPLLRREARWVGGLPRGAVVAWPLLPGDGVPPPGVEIWGPLKDRGVSVVQFVSVRLGPETARRLCEGLELPDATWEALFHGRGPDPREWARSASAAGLTVAMPRPLPREQGERRLVETNRRLAESLAWAGELASRLVVGDARAQSYFRAARHVDECSWDLGSLWREDNLGVLPWLEPAARELVEERLAGRDGELERLWRSYLEEEP